MPRIIAPATAKRVQTHANSYIKPVRAISTPQPSNYGVRRALVTIALVAACACTAFYWWQRGQPVALATAPAGKSHCLSYSPYRLAGETPYDKDFVVSPQRIDGDLALLAAVTRCVRTYSVQQGLAAVPEAARKAGLKVWLGVWIGRDAAENRREIALAIEVARGNRDVIEAVIVGNEVLLRREQTPERLAAMIAEVRMATALPVTYAEVWEFWLRSPALAPAVDFVTVHMLPYWEDEPIAVAHAVAHAIRMVDRVQAAFPDKEIVIGEAGWPSAGRWRGGATPSLVNEARFLRELAAAAQARGMRYNLIEAFDQPWKRGQEGAMGGHWGIFDSAGNLKFDLAGAVAEDPHWQRGLWAIAAGALAFLTLAFVARTRTWTGALIAGAAGGATGGTLAAQWQYLFAWNRYAVEWVVTVFYTFAALLLAILIALTLARCTDRGPVRAPRLLAPLRALFLFGAAVMALLLVSDPRYRGFPLALHAVPAVGLALYAGAYGNARASIEERVLAGWLTASAPYIIWNEGLQNLPALAWAAVAVLYAVPLFASARALVPASTTTASANPTAAGS